MRQYKKNCLVSSCLNDSKETPEKYFVRIPNHPDRRKKWCEILRTEIGNGKFFVCEDHFNLQEDSENWMYYKTIGTKLILKKDVVPHRNIYNITNISSQFTFSEKKRKQENLDRWKSSGAKKKLIREEPPSCSSIQTTFTLKNQNDPLAINYPLSTNYLYIPELIETPSSLENTSQESLGTNIKIETDIEIEEHEIHYPEVYIKEENREINPADFLDTTEDSLEAKVNTGPDTEINEYEFQFPKIYIKEEKDSLSFQDTTEESSITKIKTETDIKTDKHKLHFPEVRIKQEIKEETDLQSPTDTTRNFVFIAMPKLENIFQ